VTPNRPTTSGADVPTLAEVRQLWDFLDGAIMDPSSRARLRRGWGFCGRHAWAYAMTEIELRGGVPFSTSILYQDLTHRAAQAVGRSGLLPWGMALGRLRSRQVCPTCDYLSTAQAREDPATEERWRRVGGLRRTRPLIRRSRGIWLASACPRCADGGGLPCRPHLLQGVSPPEPRARLAAYLWDLSRRLRAYVRSSGAGGAAPAPDEESAWVEALGWFAGWEPAEALAAP
jgi:hypothetical protein